MIGGEAGLTFPFELHDMMQNFLLNLATLAILLHFTVKRCKYSTSSSSRSSSALTCSGVLAGKAESLPSSSLVPGKPCFLCFFFATLPSPLELQAKKDNLYPTVGLVVDHLHADAAPVAEIDFEH